MLILLLSVLAVGDAGCPGEIPAEYGSIEIRIQVYDKFPDACFPYKYEGDSGRDWVNLPPSGIRSRPEPAWLRGLFAPAGGVLSELCSETPGGVVCSI